MEKIVALCANRGFIYPSSEIYGGINGFWDYGPLGTELRNNIKAEWWQLMVRERDDVVGLDSSIIANPQTWVASGHVAHFHDPMVDCKLCKKRFRPDQVDPSDRCAENESGTHDLTEPRQFNLMLQTSIGATEDKASIAYLRAETCQSIFLDFKRVMQSSRKKPPFGIAQIGKAFRNEINPRNFIFRSREFEQMEMEFFTPPAEAMDWFERWRAVRMEWHKSIGLDPTRLHWREHAENERAHYAAAAYDIEFDFPFGRHELEGVHNRTDFDLKAHTEHSGKDMSYTNAETKERYTPYVVETSVGVDRCLLAALASAYVEDEVGGDARTLLKLHPKIAPFKAAVLPLSKKLSESCQPILKALRTRFNIDFDVSGSIGKRYRRHDEIGTPFCITYDFESEEDHKVTIRDRDTTTQQRVPIDGLLEYLATAISGDVG